METIDRPHIFSDISSISNPYRGILLDAYGVFWNGNDAGLIPHALKSMENLVSSGKVVGILSNATVLAKREVEKLARYGMVLGKHFHFLITSGEVAKNLFMGKKLPFPTPHRKYWFIQEPHPKLKSHVEIFKDSEYQQTLSIDEADFIYVPVPHHQGQDQFNPEIFRSYVEQIGNCSLPMVCVNPDRFAHEGNPPRPVVRDGSIAALYEELGGKTFYIGKPSSLAFEAAMMEFRRHHIQQKNQILMVGDTPETDIKGANLFGMPSALITQTGMTAHRIQENGFNAILRQLPKNEMPKYFIERLGRHEL